MKIFVTGAGGFIGSHLVENLILRGHQVVALVRYNSHSSDGYLKELRCNYNSDILTIARGDVTDAVQMQKLIANCDAVCHLAALIGIPYSYDAPYSYMFTNIQGTLNILESCKQYKIRRLVITSTSEVYGTAKYSPIDENHPLQGQSPYSATKIAADKLAESYFRSFNLPVVTIRPFNTFGPKQSARAIIPTIFTQALAGANEIRLGSLTPKRDLTFVTDTAEAFALAIEAPGIDGETIHFGSGQAIAMGDLAQKCLSIVNSNAKIITSEDRVRPANSEVELLLCNPSKAAHLLNWRPKTSLSSGLEQTAEYIRRNMSQYDSTRYTL
jgi:NAD dependent epimerase/dehydratase